MSDLMDEQEVTEEEDDIRIERQRLINAKSLPSDYIIIPHPKPEINRWYCMKCSTDYQKMLLFPIQKDIPAEYWICSVCKRKITLQERDQVYEEERSAAQQLYEFDKFDYDLKTGWIIQSANWVGKDRLTSRRQKISPATRKDLLDKFRDVIRDRLQIHIQGMKDYFIE